ncbi:MAG: AAA family ATPase [Actinobacteria bacterium]|nr:AAA family ATPase [Actinomycetota bacterium]
MRELLLRFVIAGAQSLPVERLITDLWPESENRTTTSTVRTYVARLRGVLPADLVVTRTGGYALDRSQVDVDAEQFADEVRRAGSLVMHDPEPALELVRRALERWRGRAFEEVAHREWAAAPAAQLEAARLDALELEAEAELAIGGQAAAVAARLAELTRDHPLRERLWRHRMVALYHSGRQADALACYQEVRQLLQEELGIEPGAELRELEGAILRQDPSLTVEGPGTWPVDLELPADPEPTSGVLLTTLIGREADLHDVTSLLEHVAIVTLTGPAGVGKSRLAREVAGRLRRNRSVRIVTAELAQATTEDAAITTILGELGVSRRAGADSLVLLRDALSGTQLLLLLDNCEHLAAELGRFAAELARRVPEVRILATSREPLGVAGERVHRVAPLDVPAAEASTDEIAGADAVRLFVDRARVVSRDFGLDESNARVIANICRRLDGLPFAIELAAARMRMFTPRDVESRLDERFGLLTGAPTADARYETLREAITWSYELLGASERRSLQQLSVFVGSFDVRDAAAVIDPDHDGDEVDIIASLIDRSLLVVERQRGEVRYRMLETVRAYAHEQLEASGELAAARNRHARHLARVAVRAGDLLHGPREVEGLAVVTAALDDLRAAFEWCIVAGRWTDAARMVTSVPWERVGRTVQWEITRLAVRLVAEGPELDPRLDARLRGTATIGHWLAGDADAARTAGDAALEVAARADDETYIVTALAVAWVRWESGDEEGAAMLYAPLADPSLGDRVPDDVAAYCLGGMVMGMTERAIDLTGEASAFVAELTETAIALAERSGSPTATAMAHLARAYSLLDADLVTAQVELGHVASVDGLALPTWALHARSHLARLRAAVGDVNGLHEELADILTIALATVDEMHLRMIGGFVGGALAVAGHLEVAPTLRPLAVEIHTIPGHHGWRPEVAQLMGSDDARPSVPSLTGLELERVIRAAISDLATAG